VFFAVNITTYKRSDGTTLEKLRCALDSVFSQSYTKFKVFVIGDNYEDPAELFELCMEYDQKYIYCENLTGTPERDRYLGNKNAVWSYGGIEACNYAIEKALNLGYDYICHLDHDDYWAPDHLYNLSLCIENTNSPWVCTGSHYLKIDNFCPPGIDLSLTSSLYDEFRPKAGHVIHSSTCINFRRIPLRYTDLFKLNGHVGLPADAYMWEQVANWLKEHGEKSYIVKRATCFHLTEGYERKNKNHIVNIVR
jgi:glycosyltransferase involved in cell wall biosynthesis